MQFLDFSVYFYFLIVYQTHFCNLNIYKLPWCLQEQKPPLYESNNQITNPNVTAVQLVIEVISKVTNILDFYKNTLKKISDKGP